MAEGGKISVSGFFVFFLLSFVVALIASGLARMALRIGGDSQRLLGSILAGAVIGSLLWSWTAITYLHAESYSSAHGPAWLIWAAAIWLAIQPYALSSSNIGLSGLPIADRERVRTTLGVAGWIQTIALLLLFFNESALRWWDQLNPGFF